MKKIFLVILSFCFLIFGIAGCSSKGISKNIEPNFKGQEMHNDMIQCLYGCPSSKRKKSVVNFEKIFLIMKVKIL